MESSTIHHLVLYIRPARRKAKVAAIQEAVAILNDLGSESRIGGPLSEQKGVFWLDLPFGSLDLAQNRLSRLGYTYAVDVLTPFPGKRIHFDKKSREGRFTKWRGEIYRLDRIYEEDNERFRALSPDRRLFVLETSNGQVRSIRGYRGDGAALSRRALPVYDARLLVNLVFQRGRGKLLDPFAGAGGVVIEALESGWQVLSTDIDKTLRYGLKSVGSQHVVADARALPFATGSVDAISTEPPYHQQVADAVPFWLREMYRVSRTGARIAILCAAWQAPTLRLEATKLNLKSFLDSPINRKGLDVNVLAWQK